MLTEERIELGLAGEDAAAEKAVEAGVGEESQARCSGGRIPKLMEGKASLG